MSLDGDPYGPLRDFYARYADARDPARRVAWGAEWDQGLRFAGLLAGLPPDIAETGGTLLDVGCGLGALADHLPASVGYVGIDLLPHHIAQAKAMRGGGEASRRFELGDVLNWRRGPYDWVICSGTLNVKIAGDDAAQSAWFRRCLEAMWALAGRGMMFNCLLDTEPLAEEDHLLRMPRDTIATYCRALTPRIVLREDVLPHELTAWCYRGPSAVMDVWMSDASPHDAAHAALRHRLADRALTELDAAGPGADSENLRALAELQQGRLRSARRRLTALLDEAPEHKPAQANLLATRRMLGDDLDD